MKIYKVLFVLILIVIICFPFGAMVFFFEETEEEYKQYANTNPVSWKDVVEGELSDLTTNIEGFLSEHAAKRQGVISAWSKMLYDIDVSSDINRIVLGKDKMLFYGFTVLDRRSIKPPGMKTAGQRNAAILNIAEYCEEQGAEFIYAISPNKETVYPEMLPYWYTETGGMSSREALVKAYYEKGYDYKLLDLSEKLVEQKQVYGEDLFPDTDAHWSLLGAYLSFVNMLENLESEYTIPKLYDYTVRDFNGMSSSRMLGIYNDAIEDFITSVNYENKIRVEPTYLEEDDRSWKSYQQFENPNALNDAKVLVIRDSYVTTMLDYFAATFSETRIIHYEKILPNAKTEPSLKSIMVNYQPDLVIFEMVERAFNNFDKMDEAITK